MKIDLDRQIVSSDDGKNFITFVAVENIANDVRGFGHDPLVDKARSLRNEINRRIKAREEEEQLTGDDGNE